MVFYLILSSPLDNKDKDKDKVLVFFISIILFTGTRNLPLYNWTPEPQQITHRHLKFEILNPK